MTVEEEFKRGEVEITTDQHGNSRVRLIIDEFPLYLWAEWNEDCKTRYNDMRWLKIISDHLVSAQRMNERDDIVDAVFERIAQTQVEKEEEEEKKVKTFGGEL